MAASDITTTNKVLSLFDNEKIFSKNTLHITKDGEVVNLSVKEIFDSAKYNSFIGITFSVTSTFINRYLSDFDDFELVIGIPEKRVHYGANMAAKQIKAKIEADLNNEPAELYQGLTTKIKQKLSEKKVELLVPLASVIHSKFYLLSHKDSNDTRLILGSANLSEQAFHASSNQFENIIILDNHPLFDIYTDYYYDQLQPQLTNYFSKELLDINAKKLKKLNTTDSENIDEIILLNNNDIAKVKEQSVLETLELTDKKIALGVLPVTVKEEMRNINDDRQKEIRTEREAKKQEDIAYTLVKQAISPRAKEPKIKAKNTLKKMVNEHVKVVITQTDQDTGLPERKMLVNSPAQRNLQKNITGLFTPSDLEKDSARLQPLGKKATLEEIESSLEILDQFILTFKKYTIKYNYSYGARVIEAVLYTFTAPFLSEIKKYARSEEERNDIPQFLFLGGTAGSGKSSLLKTLAKLINQPNAVDYNSIVPTGGRRKKETVDVIGHWMSESNVAPLLIDEIPEDFFTNPNYGNELIVNTTNRTSYNLQQCPTLIGTTNADGYTLEERARRRSYYLKLDKTFDEMLREDSQPAYNNVYDNLDDTLFNDFIIRMAERLSDDSLRWDNFGDAGKIDFLYHSREIFKEYYKEANFSLPEYFPSTRYDDSKETNQEKWRKLFLGTSQNEFKFDKISGNLLFKTSLLDENISRFGDGKPSEVYKNALSPKVIVGSKDGTDIELDTPLFFEWINVDNPFISYYKESFKMVFEDRPKIFVDDLHNNTTSVDLKNIVEHDNPIAIQRHIEYIPKDILIKRENSTLTLQSENFYQWLGVTPHRNFWQKFFAER